MSSPRVLLLRHGETEWSRSGQHTSHTDIPLTDRGRVLAKATGDVGRYLLEDAPVRVWCSPRSRARDTAELAGLTVERVDDRLVEWDYGEYEGLTTEEIRRRVPGWTVWDSGAPGGETAEEVGARVDRVIARLSEHDGPSAVFAHGHLLRVLGARWMGLPAQAGALLALSTATLSALGHERERRVLALWNDGGHLT